MSYDGAERRTLNGQHEAIAKSAGREGAKQVLTTLGCDVENPLDMQADFQHLRNHRIGSQAIVKRGKMVLVTTVVTGGMALLWMGFKDTVLEMLHMK
jgi:hypothetical protein